MTSPIQPGNRGPTPNLDQFVETARTADQVAVAVDGHEWAVVGWGRTPSGREVAALDPSLDSTALLLRALTDRFGPVATQSAARALGLGPAPGQPIATRVIEQAVDASEAARSALNGVDFVTQVSASAVNHGRLFGEFCRQFGLSEASLTDEQRRAIDEDVSRHITTAQESGHQPVTVDEVRSWVFAALRGNIQAT